MSDPIDDFFAEKTADNSARRQREFEMWTAWKAAPDHQKADHLEPLLDAFHPLVVQKTKEWKPPMIPQSAFHAEMHKHLINAFESYNPNRGAALTTHVHHRVQKAKRYVTQYQNMAYIPEGKVRFIGPINKATDHLTEELGRAPTHTEIADHLGMHVKQVTEVQKSMRRDIPSSAWETDPDPARASREQEVLSLLHTTLSTDEQAVFEHIYGTHGRAKIDSTGELARRLGKSESQVSRLKTSIIGKYKMYM